MRAIAVSRLSRLSVKPPSTEAPASYAGASGASGHCSTTVISIAHTIAWCNHHVAYLMTSEPLQISITKAASLLDYDERTIRRLIARGELSAVGARKLLRIDMQSIHAYRERQRRATHAATTQAQG